MRAAVLLGVLTLATPRAALGHPLHGGVALGGSFTDGARGGIGGLVALHGGYALSDTFRAYANLQYVLAVADAANTPRHEGSVSAGVVYLVDVMTWVPWAGVGLGGAIVATPAWSGLVPFGEVRGGLDWLPSPHWGGTLQVAYGLAFLNRSDVANMFSVLLGVRYTIP